jgi:hypothetical protein
MGESFSTTSTLLFEELTSHARDVVIAGASGIDGVADVLGGRRFGVDALLA